MSEKKKGWVFCFGNWDEFLEENGDDLSNILETLANQKRAKLYELEPTERLKIRAQEYKTKVEELRKFDWLETKEKVFEKNEKKLIISNDFEIFDIASRTQKNNTIIVLATAIFDTQKVGTLRILKSLETNKNKNVIVIHPNSETKIANLKIHQNSTERILSKAIIFSEEHFQAGMGILSYFNTYLNDNYPDEKAVVSIEQDGLTVRMHIKTATGKTDVVEEALAEYGQIVMGQAPIESFGLTNKTELELQSRLLMAEAEIKLQEKMIGFLQKDNEDYKTIICRALTTNNTITVEQRANLAQSTEVKVEVNVNVSQVLGGIRELAGVLPVGAEQQKVEALSEDVKQLEQEKDPNKVASSPVMSKLKRFINKANEEGTALNEAISKAEEGWEIFSDIAEKYNGLAQWCGLPVVPKVLMKGK